jgi:hypothetical protein
VAYNRKRGAQPRNRNALRHGFYSGALTKKMRAVLRRAEKIDPQELQNEIDIMRTQMWHLIDASPKNLTVLTLAARVLVKMVAVDYGMGREQEDGIHESLASLIRELVPGAKGVADGA